MNPCTEVYERCSQFQLRCLEKEAMGGIEVFDSLDYNCFKQTEDCRWNALSQNTTEPKVCDWSSLVPPSRQSLESGPGNDSQPFELTAVGNFLYENIVLPPVYAVICVVALRVGMKIFLVASRVFKS